MRLHGIPYLGEHTQDIEKHIRCMDICNNIKYESLYDLIQAEKSRDKLVIIEDNEGVWLSYLRDIRFNYRDKEVFIPYYSYDTTEIDERYRKKYRGHIIETANGIKIRYNYKLCKRTIDLDSIITLYDISTDKKYNVTFNEWFSGELFDIQKLYQLYIEYCEDYEDHTVFKHVEGYHYISKYIPGHINHERELRKENGLSDYHTDSGKDIILNYRDVRNLSKSEYEAKIGINFSNKNYWERVLDFESLLFCVLRQGVQSNNSEFNKEYRLLGESKYIIKYGDKVKLIFKDYWLNGHSTVRIKTWSRA